MWLSELLGSGCEFIGWLVVIAGDEVLFEGDGDYFCWPYDEWTNRIVDKIYFDRYKNCLCIEVV